MQNNDMKGINSNSLKSAFDLIKTIVILKNRDNLGFKERNVLKQLSFKPLSSTNKTI